MTDPSKHVPATHTCRRDHRGWRGWFRLTDRDHHCHVTEATRRAEAKREAERQAWDAERAKMPAVSSGRRHGKLALMAALGAALACGVVGPEVRRG